MQDDLYSAVVSTGAILDQRFEETLDLWIPVLARDGRAVMAIRNHLGDGDIPSAAALLNDVIKAPPGEEPIGEKIVATLAAIMLAQIIQKAGARLLALQSGDKP